MHYILFDSTRTNHIKIISQVRLENYIKFINGSNFAKNYAHYAQWLNHATLNPTQTLHTMYINPTQTLHTIILYLKFQDHLLHVYAYVRKERKTSPAAAHERIGA